MADFKAIFVDLAALGCPMTQATAVYARLLGGETTLTWGGATLAWDTVPRPDKPSEPRHGIRVSRAG